MCVNSYFKGFVLNVGSKYPKLFQNPIVLAQVAILVSGLTGSAVISVFSTGLEETGFLVPRSINATAVLFTEPDVSLPRTTITRRSSDVSSNRDPSCNRPIINLGALLKHTHSCKPGHRCVPSILSIAKNASSTFDKNLQNLVTKIGQRISNKIQTFQNTSKQFTHDFKIANASSTLLFGGTENRKKWRNLINKISMLPKQISMGISMLPHDFNMAKAKFYEALRIQCLVPRLLRPWEPIFDYARCKMGLQDDGSMEAPGCNAASPCVNPVTDEREITRSQPIPMDVTRLEVNTIDDCFPEMRKIEYGSRTLIKLVDDESCEDPRNTEVCQELLNQNRVISEEDCKTPEYVVTVKNIRLRVK